MSQPIDDREFEEYLSRRSQVSRSYAELGDSEVPPHLDQGVLAQAAKAAEKKLAQPMRNWTRWAAPLALAASMVLTVSIVIDSGVQEEGTTVAFPARTAPQVESFELQQDVSPSSSDVGPASQPVVPAAPPPPAESLRRSERSPERKAQPAPAPAAQPSQPQALEKVEVHAFRQVQGVQQSPSAIVAIEEEARDELTANAAESAQGANANADAAAADQRARNENRALTSRRSTASEVDLSEVMVTGTHRQAQSSAGAGPRNTVPIRSEPSAAQIEKQEREATPALWLEYIRELRADGKTRQANREWRAFRDAYPNVVVGEDDVAREPR